MKAFTTWVYCNVVLNLSILLCSSIWISKESRAGLLYRGNGNQVAGKYEITGIVLVVTCAHSLLVAKQV